MRAGEEAVRGASINRADDLARAGLHDLADLRTRELQGGPESEEQAGEHGDRDTEREHGQVNLDVGLVRERIFRQRWDDDGERAIGEEHAENGSGEGEQQGLGQELADEAWAAGADGGANGEFMLAHRAAGQEKDGDVAASDGEQKGYCCEQEIQSTTEIMNEIVVQADNIELEMAAGKMLGRFLRELVDQGS